LKTISEKKISSRNVKILKMHPVDTSMLGKQSAAVTGAEVEAEVLRQWALRQRAFRQGALMQGALMQGALR
jgi:hypothetical protein